MSALLLPSGVPSVVDSTLPISSTIVKQTTRMWDKCLQKSILVPLACREADKEIAAHTAPAGGLL